MKKVLVTGGAGFIGSHIADRLVSLGYEVLVLDNLRTGKLHNLNSIIEKITFHEGSILDSELLTKILDGVTYVFHEAAVASVPESVSNPEETHLVNVTGTLNVLESARKAGVRRVVYASSSAVYGDDPELPKREDMPLAPLSPYALHKSINEQYAKLYSDLYGVETVGLRYFNVFGPRQDARSQYSGVISKFVMQALKKNAATIFGDGENTRDFVYVADAVEANILALQAPDASGQIFNVGCGDTINLKQLHDAVGKVVGFGTAPIFGPVREGDIRHSASDITRARRVLGYFPATSLVEGLKETMRFYSSS